VDNQPIGYGIKIKFFSLYPYGRGKQKRHFMGAKNQYDEKSGLTPLPDPFAFVSHMATFDLVHDLAQKRKA
jgi:hypothetical protein